jgi:hypothetical protein
MHANFERCCVEIDAYLAPESVEDALDGVPAPAAQLRAVGGKQKRTQATAGGNVAEAPAWHASPVAYGAQAMTSSGACTRKCNAPGNASANDLEKMQLDFLLNDAQVSTSGTAVPKQIVHAFEPILTKHMRMRCSRVKSEEYWNDIWKYCKGETRPEGLNHNYYRYIKMLTAVEVDGVHYLINKKNNRLWIHENKVISTLWHLLEQAFKIDSWTQQRKHMLKACEYIDNVPQHVVLDLYEIVKNYRAANGPSGSICRKVD